MDNNLEHLIKLSKEVAKPWKFTTIVLAALLAFSIYSNISISKRKAIFNFSADSNIESTKI